MFDAFRQEYVEQLWLSHLSTTKTKGSRDPAAL
jgi:hypothetical protein